ncbi:hypothetical protein PV734_29070 [Streptomyces sp. AK08-02]|nr:hypothetical protein [Streptomyces sp. AK08-02]
MDEYVPLTVQWEGYSRLQDAPRSVVLEIGESLVEVKTDRNSGEVVEVVLLDLVRPECVEDVLDITETKIDPGVPCVSFDESDLEGSNCEVRLYADGLQIRFADGRAARRFGDTKAMFGFSDPGRLVEFKVRLKPDLMARLRSMCHLVR